MVDLVFDYKIRANPSAAIKFRTNSVQFGDGYSQSVGEGINPRLQEWSFSITGTDSVVECGPTGDYLAAKAFLDARKGYESFLWTPPGESQIRVKCADYTLSKNGPNVFTLSGKFTQVFYP